MSAHLTVLSCLLLLSQSFPFVFSCNLTVRLPQRGGLWLFSFTLSWRTYEVCIRPHVQNTGVNLGHSSCHKSSACLHTENHIHPPSRINPAPPIPSHHPLTLFTLRAPVGIKDINMKTSKGAAWRQTLFKKEMYSVVWKRHLPASYIGVDVFFVTTTISFNQFSENHEVVARNVSFDKMISDAKYIFCTA